MYGWSLDFAFLLILIVATLQQIYENNKEWDMHFCILWTHIFFFMILVYELRAIAFI